MAWVDNLINLPKLIRTQQKTNMTVVISPSLTRTSDGFDPKTGKKVRKIFHPSGKIEIWELNGAGEPVKQIK